MVLLNESIKTHLFSTDIQLYVANESHPTALKFFLLISFFEV